MTDSGPDSLTDPGTTGAAGALTVGIRREDKNRWERRAPLAPGHVGALVRGGVRVLVQPSGLRTFPDADYAAAGAEVSEDLSACDVVLAVKEIPAALFQRGRTYAFFSHTVKGQPYNMPMLRRLLELGCHLIDYERIVDVNGDAAGRRLVAFGRHAGLAGAVETLRALGQRLAAEGCPTPLADIRPAYAQDGVSGARTAIADVARRLDAGGLPAAIRPLVIGVAGYGNVSAGVQEMLEPLALARVAPQDLAGIQAGDPGRYLVVFEERHMVSRRDGGAFALQEYYDHPERYRGVFARWLPHLTVLVNAIYWAPRYPPLITADDLRALYPAAGPAPRLRVIGDITCDIEGSIPCTVRATSPDAPCYVWDPHTGEAADGVVGRGPVVMAVDNLPCELPADATRDFGDALLPFVEPMARAARAGWPRCAEELPPELAPALIACHGALTERYRYLAGHLDRG